MREYEFTVVVDLAVTESGDSDAGVEVVTAHVEARGGRVIKVDHWGRRRMAYPIRGAIDGDYIVTRIELPTDAIQPLADALRIDERIYRHLVVRADELPPPAPPREPRVRPDAGEVDARVEREPAGRPVAAAPPAEAAAAAPPAEEVAAAPPTEEVAAAPPAEDVAAAPPAEDVAAALPTEDVAAAPPTEDAAAAPADPPETAEDESATEGDEVETPPATVDDEQPPAD